MADEKLWLLPDGVDEVLPPRARVLEELRRRMLDLFERWGYEYVMPPVVEYLDSLLSGIGEDLDLQTFKITDQITGRMLGVRADITPQVARIDAHRLPSAAPQRFCYLGPVLHTRPDKFAGSRNPLQIGAELYGHAGIEADAEVVSLLLELLAIAGIKPVTLELGHMGLFHAICELAHFDRAMESRILERLLMKDEHGLAEALAGTEASAAVGEHLNALLALNGDDSVLGRAREALKRAPVSVMAALDDIERLVALIRERVPAADIHLDFAELRGYRYHTGVMFAAYTPTVGRAIAWGGRYDNIGHSFGRPRPATGFSTDLKVLAGLSGAGRQQLPKIFAPAADDPARMAAIGDLRVAGYRVVEGLPGQTASARDMGCEQVLVERGGQWQLDDI
ncbi:MAG: ATP phosphoribosyltransferase regulatory subunit [Gammaproteobacteria bacterium]|nr:ATP phosphoribosyltransferase regulatory subunit [Gammaproteobacteria bacterium]